MAADHLFELDAELLALAAELEGHPDNVAAALFGGFVVCADGEAVRMEPPTGLEALAVVPEQAVRTTAARAALGEHVALTTPSSTSVTALSSRSGSPAATST